MSLGQLFVYRHHNTPPQRFDRQGNMSAVHSPSELRLTGILYPPAGDDTDRSIGDKCEEFSLGELDDMVNGLVSLPLWVEHDEDRLVGEVLSARKTFSGAVEVTAVVRASNDNGRKAITDILERKMLGLSLSHSYDLTLENGSPASREIQVALCDGKDWRSVASDGHAIRKTLRELSLTCNPAREGCHIHEIVCASKERMGEKNPQQRVVPINMNSAGHPCVDRSFVGVFSASMEGATPASTAPPTTAAPIATGEPVNPAADPAQSSVAGEAVAQAAQLARDSQGRFTSSEKQPEAAQPASAKPEATDPAEPIVTQPDAPPQSDAAAQPEPTSDDIKTTQESAEALRQAAEQLKAVNDEITRMKEAHEKAMKDMDARVKANAEAMKAKDSENAKLQSQLDENKSSSWRLPGAPGTACLLNSRRRS